MHWRKEVEVKLTKGFKGPFGARTLQPIIRGFLDGGGCDGKLLFLLRLIRRVRCNRQNLKIKKNKHSKMSLTSLKKANQWIDKLNSWESGFSRRHYLGD